MRLCARRLKHMHITAIGCANDVLERKKSSNLIKLRFSWVAQAFHEINRCKFGASPWKSERGCFKSNDGGGRWKDEGGTRN